jgi:hypothetical protein
MRTSGIAALAGIALLTGTAAVARPSGDAVGGKEIGETGCTTIYLPVCARGADGKLNTYSNACTARRANATVSHIGTCDFPGEVQVGPYPWPWPWATDEDIPGAVIACNKPACGPPPPPPCKPQICR